MPRYFFHLVKGEERVLDSEGIEAPEEVVTSPAVLALIKEIGIEEPDLLEGREGWSIQIMDEQGRVVNVVPL